jgi:hypothetical protein
MLGSFATISPSTARGRELLRDDAAHVRLEIFRRERRRAQYNTRRKAKEKAAKIGRAPSFNVECAFCFPPRVAVKEYPSPQTSIPKIEGFESAFQNSDLK